jgi:hypothetical protein
MMKKSLVTLASVLAFAGLVAAEDAREVDHRELRAMLVTVRDAINHQQIEKMAPVLAKHFSIILADGQLVADLGGLESYYKKLLEPATGLVRSITVNPSADELTTFLDSNAGVCHGTSTDSFVLSDGKTRVLTSRWTAALVKEDGAWKIAALQAGANVLDNPILDEYKHATQRLVAGAGVGAFALALLGFAIGRRSARA